MNDKLKKAKEALLEIDDSLREKLNNNIERLTILRNNMSSVGSFREDVLELVAETNELMGYSDSQQFLDLVLCDIALDILENHEQY